MADFAPANKLDAWDLPGVLQWARARRERWFAVTVPDDLGKLEFLREQMHELAVQPLIIELAVRLTRPYRADDWKAQADALHRFVRDGIKFVRHPDGKQQIADDSIWRGYGACTEKVLAFAALCRAIGMDADFVPCWRGDHMFHVQSCVRWPGCEKEPLVRTVDAPGALRGPWIVSDPTTPAGLGVDPATLPKNPETGRTPLR